jgi:hypothetical protein
VTVEANALDASGIASVEFYLDGSSSPWCSDVAEPFSCPWDTTTTTNAPHVLQTRAYDPWGNSDASAPIGVTVSNPASLPNLVQNGGFEAGTLPWAFAGTASRVTGSTAHSGAAYALLGNRTKTSGTVSQVLTIPASGPAELSFWLSITSNEKSTTAVDFLYVEVLDLAGTNLLGTVGTYSNLDRVPAGWTFRAGYSLAEWAGRSVTLRFRTSNNNKFPSSFSIDDVALQ